MPTKKKVPQAKLSKKDSEFLKFIGKNISDMRKTLASVVGGQSKLENDSAATMQLARETSSKVRKLIVDPLYSVPARLEKTVTELKTDTLRKFTDVYTKLRSLDDDLRPLKKSVKLIEKKFKDFDLAFDVQKEKVGYLERSEVGQDETIKRLEKSVGDLTSQLEQLQSEHQALAEEVEDLTEIAAHEIDKEALTDGTITGTIETTPRGSLGEEVEDDGQVTLDQAIEAVKRTTLEQAKVEGDSQNANPVT